jgi:multidrug resistance efflux pump
VVFGSNIQKNKLMDPIPSAIVDYTLESYLTRVKTKSRIIYWIIIIIIISGIAILPLVSVDVAVKTRGFFQSEISKQVVYAPFHGKVIYSSVKDGREVNRGDTLLIIDSETTRAQKKAIEKRLSDNSSAITDLELLVRIEKPEKQLSPKQFVTRRYYTEYNNLIKSWRAQFQRFQKSTTQYERAEVLHEQNIIPDAEYENTLYTYRAEEEELNRILASQKSIWQADLMQRKNEATSLNAELGRCLEDLSNRIVRAPLAGRIIQSTDIQTGTIVSLNQQVAKVSPSGELVATCLVKPGDIGLINKDQNIRIQVDALNYNEWGILSASIIDISDDLVIEEGSSVYFRIKCKPEYTFLSLKNGVKAELKKGMSFSGRIVVTRRTLFNLLFDKADKWLNPYLSREKNL